MKTYTCEHCGKKFKDYEANRKIYKRTFCSRKCYSKWTSWAMKNGIRHSHLPKNREVSQETKKKLSNSLKEYYKNNKHWRAGKKLKERIKIKCKECGKDFEVLPYIAKRGRKFCSKKCANTNKGKKFNGKNHPFWKGGRKDYRGSNWHTKRKIALKRDDYTCQKCGKKKDLVVHHIVAYEDNGSNELENLLTLCRSCHSKTEWQNGKIRN